MLSLINAAMYSLAQNDSTLSATLQQQPHRVSVFAIAKTREGQFA